MQLAIQFIAAHVIYAAESGDTEHAARMIEHGFQLSRAISYDGVLVSHMIRHAAEGLMTDVTERALNRARFSDAQLRRIADALRDEKPDSLKNCMRTERCLGIRTFQSVKTGVPEEALYGQRPRPWWKRAWQRLRRGKPAYSDEDFLNYLRVMESWIRLTTAPPLEASAAAKANDAFSASATSEIGASVLVAFSKALEAHARLQSRITLLRTALAIERYRLGHGGEPPASLDAVVPAYLPEVPEDIFDRQPVRFGRLAAGYRIYNIGPDGKDDGGTEKSQSAGGNYDVTFTVERMDRQDDTK